MTATATTRPDADERRAADRKRLEQAIQALTTSEGWRRWLATRATFHSYSFHNSLLIASQRPDATRVAGFKTWKKLGRVVRKGERAIWIFAPRTYTTDNDAGEPEKRIYFRAVPVFDIAQTDGEPLPEPPREPVDGDSHAHCVEPLRDLAHQLGYTTRMEALADSCGGYCNPRGMEIVINTRTTISANATVHVLVHELAHALGIGYEGYGRDRAEALVESVTYIVCSAIGLDTSGESVPYVAGWDTSNLDDLRRYAETIDATARRIEQALPLTPGKP